MILVVIPTVTGREASLERCLASYGERHPISMYRGAPTCGEGWRLGLEAGIERYGEPDYVHLSCDDIEAVGRWWEPAIEAADRGLLAAPIIRNPDGSLQSAGGSLGAPDDLIKEIQDDWFEVDFTTLPFMSWEQWQRIGMQDLHYCSDVWVSYRGSALGYQTVLRHGYEFVHHLERPGRLPASRAGTDRKLMQEALGAR